MRTRTFFEEASPIGKELFGQGPPSLYDSRDNAECSCLPGPLEWSNSYLFTLRSKCLMWYLISDYLQHFRIRYLSVIWREMRDREKRGQKQIKRFSVRYDLLYFESDLQC